MGNPDMPTPAAHRRQAGRDGRQAAHQPLFGLQGHSGPAQGAGRLLRAPVRREAQSRDPGGRDAGLQGRLRQHGAGHHRAGRRHPGAEPDLSHPRVRLHHLRRRHPPHPDHRRRSDRKRPARRVPARRRAGGEAFDPQAAGGRAELSVQSDRIHRRPRLLHRGRAARQEARPHHPVRHRLRRDLLRRQSAAVGAAGARRHGHHRRVHLAVQDLRHAGLAHGLCGRQRAPDRARWRA